MWSNQGGWTSGGWGRAVVSGGGGSVSLPFSTYSSNSDLSSASPPVTFSRSSSGTRFNSSGVLGTLATDVARFDYNPSTLAAKGLLVEEARTNLVAQSQSLPTSPWNNFTGTYSASGITDPTGALQKLTAGATSTNQYRIYQLSLTTTTAAHTMSFYYRAGSGITHVHVRCGGTSIYGRCIEFATDTLSTGYYDGTNASTAPTSASVTDVGNGIRRFQMTYPVSGSTDIFFYFATTSASSQATLAGGEYVYVGGVQIEVGAYPTSYIPTTTASVTRSADAASFTVPTGVSNIRTTYEDSTTADAGVTAGATYNIPTGQKAIKTIVSF